MGLSISPLPEAAAERTRGPIERPPVQPTDSMLSTLDEAREVALEASLEAFLTWWLSPPTRGELVLALAIAIIVGMVF